jgi:hypothetical protein
MKSKLAKFLGGGTVSVPARTARVARTGRLHGYTLADLQTEAHPDEWNAVKDDPQALEAFALTLRESTQVRQGIRPERWTGTATCDRCGPVPVAPFLHGRKLSGCRWCVISRAT